jgi:hypothetical protein
VALKEDDWPLSMVLGVAVGVTVSAVLTVTVTVFVAIPPMESVTLTQ